MSKAASVAASTEVATRAPQGFPALLEQSKGEIAKILPEGVSVDRVARVALTAWRMDAKVQKCTAGSILAAVMKACELGLEPGGAFKHAYLIPYGNECTFQVSVFGLLELARRSGAFLVVEARTVCERDLFDVSYTPRPVVVHKPELHDRGAEVGAYAYAILTNGEMVFEWMNRAELEQVRKLSKAGPVWQTYWGEMAKKTAVKRLLKRQPLSATLARAVEQDNIDGGGEVAGHPQGPRFAVQAPGGSRAAALAERLGAAQGGEEEGSEEAAEAAERLPGEEG